MSQEGYVVKEFLTPMEAAQMLGLSSKVIYEATLDENFSLDEAGKPLGVWMRRDVLEVLRNIISGKLNGYVDTYLPAEDDLSLL